MFFTEIPYSGLQTRLFLKIDFFKIWTFLKYDPHQMPDAQPKRAANSGFEYVRPYRHETNQPRIMDMR